MPTEEMTYREGVSFKLKAMDEKIDGIKEDLTEVLKQVRYTNGKVKKIVIVLILVVGVIIGETLSGSDIIHIIASALI